MKLGVLLVFLLAIFSKGMTSSRNSIVKTKSGSIRGLFVTKPNNNSFHSFKGIPYAEPPVGNLRFRAPVPHQPWTGIRDAKSHGNFCANKFGFFGLTQTAGGNEDCLFLNVYTPATDNKKRAVMFWIHGGAFVSGNGDSLLYGPDHLMLQDIVLVTVNYRYSAFGFLSTDDENAVGNYGLKDLVLALQWVNENIKKFGGDPKRVTVAGHSAGSSATHYLVLSDMARNFFKQAIMQSGSAFMSCHLQTNPRLHAENLGRKLGLNFTNTKELMDQLRAVDFQRIVDAENHLFLMEDPWAFRAFEFGPVVEPATSSEPKLISKTPNELMIAGSYRNISMMVGSPDFEGMFTILKLSQPGVIDSYNQHPEYLAPLSFELTADSPRRAEIIQALKNIYFGGNETGSLMQWLQAYSDGLFRFHSDRFVRFYASQDRKKLYYYEFSFDGSLNYFKKFFNLPFPGATHGDELFYLFETELPGYTADESSTLVRNRMTTMWANFVKYGNPTPGTSSQLLPIQWLPYENAKKSYLKIGIDLEMREDVLRMDAMSNLQQSLTGHY